MKLRFEVFLSLVNRGAPPAMMLLSMAVFDRYLSQGDFQSYLLIYSSTMWIVTCTFQWQKNAVIKHCSGGDNEYQNVTYAVLFLSIGLCAIVCILLALRGGQHAELIFILSTSIGLLYFLGAHLRAQKKTKYFLLLDTLSQVLRWVAAILIVIVTSSLVGIFYALALVVLAIVAYEYVVVDKHGSDQKKPGFHEIGSYLKFGIPLLTMDLAGAGFMYADRFFQQIENVDAFIIASTIANQSVSILASTILMVVYPRASTYFKEDMLLFHGYWKKSFRFVPLVVGASIPAIILGALVIDLLYQVEFDKNAQLLVSGLAICQALYYVIVCASIPLIVIGKQLVVAAMMLFFFVMYFFSLFLFEDIILVKAVLLFVAALWTYIYSYRCWRLSYEVRVEQKGML